MILGKRNKQDQLSGCWSYDVFTASAKLRKSRLNRFYFHCHKKKKKDRLKNSQVQKVDFLLRLAKVVSNFEVFCKQGNAKTRRVQTRSVFLVKLCCSRQISQI